VNQSRLHFQVVFALAGLVAVVATVVAPCAASPEPRRVLRGISAIRLNIDGMPNPPEGIGVSEESLATEIKDTLRSFSLRVAPSSDPEFVLSELPTLHLTVLIQRVEESYSYVILMRLEERCTASRNPQLSVPWCQTWSAFPAVGSVAVAQVADIHGKLLQQVTQFGKAYAVDNGH